MARSSFLALLAVGAAELNPHFLPSEPVSVPDPSNIPSHSPVIPFALKEVSHQARSPSGVLDTKFAQSRPSLTNSINQYLLLTDIVVDKRTHFRVSTPNPRRVIAEHVVEEQVSSFKLLVTREGERFIFYQVNNDEENGFRVVQFFVSAVSLTPLEFAVRFENIETEQHYDDESDGNNLYELSSDGRVLYVGLKSGGFRCYEISVVEKSTPNSTNTTSETKHTATKFIRLSLKNPESPDNIVIMSYDEILPVIGFRKVIGTANVLVFTRSAVGIFTAGRFLGVKQSSRNSNSTISSSDPRYMSRFIDLPCVFPQREIVDVVLGRSRDAAIVLFANGEVVGVQLFSSQNSHRRCEVLFKLPLEMLSKQKLDEGAKKMFSAVPASHIDQNLTQNFDHKYTQLSITIQSNYLFILSSKTPRQLFAVCSADLEHRYAGILNMKRVMVKRINTKIDDVNDVLLQYLPDFLPSHKLFPQYFRLHFPHCPTDDNRPSTHDTSSHSDYSELFPLHRVDFVGSKARQHRENLARARNTWWKYFRESPIVSSVLALVIGCVGWYSVVREEDGTMSKNSVAKYDPVTRMLVREG